MGDSAGEPFDVDWMLIFHIRCECSRICTQLRSASDILCDFRLGYLFNYPLRGGGGIIIFGRGGIVLMATERSGKALKNHPDMEKDGNLIKNTTNQEQNGRSLAVLVYYNISY